MVGHKVACTDPLFQAQSGIDSPDYGHLLDDMVLSDGAGSTRCTARPESKPRSHSFFVRTPEGPNVTAPIVLDATRAILPCLEIIDSRIEDGRNTIADNVASNRSSSAIVLDHRPPPGERHRPPQVPVGAGGERQDGRNRRCCRGVRPTCKVDRLAGQRFRATAPLRHCASG